VKRLRGCFGILLIFGFGLAVGGFLGFAAGWVTFFHKVVKGGPVAVREILYQRAKDDLGLDYEQKEEVRAIIKETATELEGITASVRPSVEDALARAEQRIQALLKPPQRAKFDKFLNEARLKWRPFLRPAREPAKSGEPVKSGEETPLEKPGGDPPN
jgi:hypothetical protein